jgi:hypothetical protein
LNVAKRRRELVAGSETASGQVLVMRWAEKEDAFAANEVRRRQRYEKIPKKKKIIEKIPKKKKRLTWNSD